MSTRAASLSLFHKYTMFDTDKTLNAVMSWKGYRRLVFVLALVTSYFIYNDVRRSGWHLACWDWMFYSGALTFMVTVALAVSASDKLDKAIEQLRTNNTLILSATQYSDILGQMAAVGRRWRWYSGFGVFLLVLSSWLFAFWKGIDNSPGGWGGFMAALHNAPTPAVLKYLSTLALVFLVIALCGFFAGTFLGATAGHGAFAGVLADENIELRIRPDHFDGAVGLKPIGDLYLFQALLTAIPLAWFAGWWLLIPHYPDLVCSHSSLSSWLWPLVAMWAVTLIFTFRGFVQPMLLLRKRVLKEQAFFKSQEVPAIKDRIENLQQLVLEKNISADKRALLNAEIDREANYLWSIDRMSAWPMDATTRRRYFSVNALVTVVPPAIDMLSRFGDKDSAQAGIWSIMRRAAGMWH